MTVSFLHGSLRWVQTTLRQDEDLLFVEAECLPAPRAAGAAADMGFLGRAVEQHRIDRETARLDVDLLGAGMLADAAFLFPELPDVVVGEQTLQPGAIEAAFAGAEQAEHPPALRMHLQWFVRLAAENFAAG